MSTWWPTGLQGKPIRLPRKLGGTGLMKYANLKRPHMKGHNLIPHRDPRQRVCRGWLATLAIHGCTGISDVEALSSGICLV